MCLGKARNEIPIPDVIMDMSGARILSVNYVDFFCNFMVLGSLCDLDPMREAIRLCNYPRCL
jgi:hypothetical protein